METGSEWSSKACGGKMVLKIRHLSSSQKGFCMRNYRGRFVKMAHFEERRIIPCFEKKNRNVDFGIRLMLDKISRFF